MSAPFRSHQEAARALIVSGAELSRKSGQFVGGTIYDPEPPSERQARWLADLLRKAGLPPLAEGGAP
jgi:hypothetical protein